MIYQDKKIETDNQLALTEYLASFWNPEGVKKIQEARKAAAKHAFKTDQEFEESVVSGQYKNNALIEAVIKLRKEAETETKPAVNSSRKSKLPTDLSSIQITMNKFK